MTKLTGIREASAAYITRPAVGLLARTGATPNTLTWLGFTLTLGAAALIVARHPLAAGLVVLFAGFFDMMDGALARRTNQATRFGAFLDSTLDRLSEAALLLAIMTVYARGQSVAGVLLVGVALTASLLVSYLRARAEGLGLKCKEGVFTRSERVIVLALGLLFGRFQYALTTALGIIVIFSVFTVAQRVLLVWRLTRSG